MRIALVFPLVLAGCASLPFDFLRPGPVPAAAPGSGADIRPQARPNTQITTPPPPPGARTVAEFDTTSAAERAEAAAEAPMQMRVLGVTVASLGTPTDPGIWIKTPLVDAVTPGRAEVVATGKSINLELRPSGGAPGAGSQISLAAMRLLEVPLTGLPELALFAR